MLRGRNYLKWLIWFTAFIDLHLHSVLTYYCWLNFGNYFYHTLPHLINRLNQRDVSVKASSKKINFIVIKIILETNYFGPLWTCPGVPNHTHMGWFNECVNSVAELPHAKKRLHSSTHSWVFLLYHFASIWECPKVFNQTQLKWLSKNWKM